MLAAARLIDRLRVPHFVMENVKGVLKSPEWETTMSFMRGRGYDSRAVMVNTNDCRVPQKRHRVFVIGSRTAGSIELDPVRGMVEEWRTAGPDTPARAAAFEGNRRLAVRDALPGVKDSYWGRARNMNNACVRPSDVPTFTVLTTCTGRPKRM